MQMLTVRQAAAKMNCTLTHVYQQLWAGKFEGATKDGTQWNIPSDAIQRTGPARHADSNQNRAHETDAKVKPTKVGGTEWQDRPLNTKQAAEMIGRAPTTLKRWRFEHLGPDCVKIRGRFRYYESVLRQFIEEHTITSRAGECGGKP